MYSLSQVPFLRMRHDLAVGEFAHLLADRIERVVEAAGADGGVAPLAHQFDEPRAARRGVAGGDEMIDAGRDARRDRGRAQAEIGEADDLALAHRNAAEHLRQIFAGADAHQKLLDLAEIAVRHHPLGVSGELADRFGVSGEPGETVGGALFAVEHPRHRPALDGDPGRHGAAGIGEQRFDGGDGFAKRRDQVLAGRRRMAASGMRRLPKARF